MPKTFLRVLLLAVMALVMVMGTSPLGQARTVQSAETVVPAYGAGANSTGDPIGGGAGYSEIYTSGDFTVTTKAQFLSAITSAESGQVIYIPEGTSIDLTQTTNIYVPAGVIIASNRGYEGSSGGRIYNHDSRSGTGFPFFLRLGAGCRVTGLRVEGPEPSYQCDYKYVNCYQGIEAQNNCEIDNCEVSRWSHGAVYVKPRATGVHVHHNYIHHNQMSGLGYGVNVIGGSALIEANTFDYCRHAISGARGYPASGYEARFNVVEPNITNSMFDMHGGNDPPSWGFADGPDPGVPAGGTILIHHNTFKSSSQIAVGIRGVPADVCRVYNNWTYWPSSQSTTAFKQRLENLGLTPYVNMEVYDNWYGRSPSSVTNQSPVLDAIGNKTVSEGTALTFAISAADPDGDALTYSASNLPEGAVFQPATRTFRWTPAYGQAGVYAGVCFQASDGNLADSEEITMRVVAGGTPQADFIGDGAADSANLIWIEQHWSETGPPGWIGQDINQDGIVNVLDAFLVLLPENRAS